LIVLLAALWPVCGCAWFQLPRIDPSGERIFAEGPIRHQPRLVDEPAVQAADDAVAVTLVPRTVVAPTGSEVVLVAGVLGPDKYLYTNRRLEWSLSAGSVGHFVAVGRNDWIDVLLRGDFNRPRKVDNSFAIGSTSRHYLRLHRGTPTPSDDVLVRAGEGWLTITSPVEGMSQVTVFAPDVSPWAARTQSATIHWIDVQWQAPLPAINPAGTSHRLVTSVMRQSDHSPRVGWLVRYEVLGGPPAGFAPDGASAIEVPTDSAGQAVAEIVQKQPLPGTNQIGIQVIRPENVPGADGRRLVVGSDVTQKTWTTPAMAVRKIGPALAAVGGVLTYQTIIGSTGDQPALDVMVLEDVPDGASYAGSNPPAEVLGRRLQWRLGTLGVGENRAIVVSYRAERAGNLTSCATVVAAGGLKASDCATTTVTATAIDLKLSGPAQAVVGGIVRFDIQVTNRGGTAIADLFITDRFDPGLEAESGEPGPIQRRLGEIPPGATEHLHVNFRVVRPGESCHTVELTLGGKVVASSRACVVAVAAGTSPIEPPATSPHTASPHPPAAGPRIAIRMSAPPEVVVGDQVHFQIDVTNNSSFELRNLQIVLEHDPQLLPVSATEGVEKKDNFLLWRCSSLPAGRTLPLEAMCQATASASRACGRVTVTLPDGARQGAEACLRVLPAGQAPPKEGLPSLVPPRASPLESEPALPPSASAAPIKIQLTQHPSTAVAQRQVTYRIHLRNEGRVAEQDVVLGVELPVEMKPILLGLEGPTKPLPIVGQTIRFDPLAELPPGEKITYHIRVVPNRAGEYNLRVHWTSRSQKKPVVSEHLLPVLPP
jgi:uncharacterized repeat protein (TIGR01451 family)